MPFLCLEFSIYPLSLIDQNNSRLSSSIFSRRRAFFAQSPKWSQLDADFISIYLCCSPIASPVFWPLLFSSLPSAPLSVSTSRTFSHVLPSGLGFAPPAEFSGVVSSAALGADYVLLSTVLTVLESSVVVLWWNWLRNLEKFTTQASSISCNTIHRRVESITSDCYFMDKSIKVYKICYRMAKYKLNVVLFPFLNSTCLTLLSSIFIFLCTFTALVIQGQEAEGSGPVLGVRPLTLGSSDPWWRSRSFLLTLGQPSLAISLHEK